MRPTNYQLYCNPEFFVAALIAHGEPAGAAKVGSLMNYLIEYWSMSRHVKGLEKERTSLHQSEQQSWAFKKDGTRLDKKTKMRENKQISRVDRTLIMARAFLKRRGQMIDKKIAKWPDMTYDESLLKNKPDPRYANKVFRKRIKKGKPRTQVLG